MNAQREPSFCAITDARKKKVEINEFHKNEGKQTFQARNSKLELLETTMAEPAMALDERLSLMKVLIQLSVDCGESIDGEKFEARF